MALKRSLGGIGRLYQHDKFMGEVYYNIPQDQPPGSIACSIVFIGSDIELVLDECRYRLFVEDGRFLVISLRATRFADHDPYLCASCDGIWHTELAYSYS